MNDDTPTPPEPHPAPPVEMDLQQPPPDMLPPPEPAYGIPILNLNGGPVTGRPVTLLALVFLFVSPLVLAVVWMWL